MPSVPVFFFRGLSTYGHDHAQWTVFDFGPVYKRLAASLNRKGLDFHPVLGMGSGPLREVAWRARAFIESHPIWQDPERPIGFLAHSTGGLVARLVLEQMGDAARGKVVRFLTVASPHRGSALAQICVEMPERYPGSAFILRSSGYNVAAKRPFFAELTPERVAEVLSHFTSDDRGTLSAEGDTVSLGKSGIQVASIVCHAPRAQWCLPLRLCYTLKAFREFAIPSDGVVELDSQAFGKVVAEIQLDHFRQVGLFGGNASSEFGQMCRKISEYFRVRS
ncbi:MAG: esterase/lipase family protein [Bdellovibrionales bacterium]